MITLLALAAFSTSIWMNPEIVVLAGPKYGKTNWSSADTPMIPFCVPGVVGTRACPCSNPQVPAGAPEGCDNGTTGGSILGASGSASIQNDTLSLDVSNSLQSLHTLYVGTSMNQGGIAFGQGVRCATGTVSLLATATPASSPPSSISFTNIYAKSSAAAVPPNPGQSYYYFVAYSSPVMPPPCQTSWNYNATNSGIVVWGP